MVATTVAFEIAAAATAQLGRASIAARNALAGRFFLVSVDGTGLVLAQTNEIAAMFCLV